MDPAVFINRKGFNSLNVLVTEGCDKLVYNAPESYHDAGVYQMYAVKPYLESRFLKNISLGVSAFPISDVSITPYSTTESNRDRNKALFHRRLSGARCEMTENLYGIWKRRFLIIRCMRVHLPNAYKIIVGTAVLHNFSVQWREVMPDNHPDLSLPPAIPDVPHQDVVIDARDLRREQQKRIGEQTRDNMRRMINEA